MKILQNFVAFLEYMSFIKKNFNNKKCTPKLIIFNENKNFGNTDFVITDCRSVGTHRPKGIGQETKAGSQGLRTEDSWQAITLVF